jgi:CRP-like cAMP-binding protein
VSLVQEFELLRQIPFFADMEAPRLKLLAFMSQRVAYDSGRVLFRQGDAADAAYLIIEGEADILVDTASGPITIATLGPHDILGEMAILCDVPRTATVRAKTRLVALRIAKEPFLRMVREFPKMAISIMRELAHRLELTNQQLRTALSELRELREGAVPIRPATDRLGAGREADAAE